MQKKISSSPLITNPSFFRGMARLLDHFGTVTKYNYSDSDEKADFKAIHSDWRMTGNYIKFAIAKYQKTNGK